MELGQPLLELGVWDAEEAHELPASIRRADASAQTLLGVPLAMSSVGVRPPDASADGVGV